MRVCGLIPLALPCSPARLRASQNFDMADAPSCISMRAPRFMGKTSEPGLPRAFNIFWVGQAMSALGDAMTVVAMPLLVLAETGSVTQMGRLTALARVGGLIATAAAGAIVDRWQPRRIMLNCDALRCGLMALVPLAFGLDLRPIGLIFVVGIVAAVAQGIFYVAHVSLIAALVGQARVSLANSRIEGTIALAYVFGPALAGRLSAMSGPALVLGVDAATFLLSALALLAMGSRASAALATQNAASVPVATSAATSEGWLVGLRFVREQPELRRLTILVALSQFFTAAVVDLFIYRLKHELGQGDTGTGLTFALASAAAVVAAASTPWLRAKVSFHKLWAIAVALQAVALLGSAPFGSFALVVAAAAAYMAAMTTLLICQASIRQEVTPQRLLGRVSSAYLVLTALPMPLGALAATALAARLGAGNVQAGIGVGLLTTAVIAVLVWSRRSDRDAR
jgi:MFS family permease